MANTPASTLRKRQRIAFSAMLLMTALYLPLSARHAHAQSASPYAQDKATLDPAYYEENAPRAIKPPTHRAGALQTEAERMAQMSPAAGSYPSAQRPIDTYLEQSALEEQVKQQQADQQQPAPRYNPGQAPVWHMDPAQAPATSWPQDAAPAPQPAAPAPSMNAPQAPMTEQVIYPPEARTAPQPLQQQEPVFNNAAPAPMQPAPHEYAPQPGAPAYQPAPAMNAAPIT
ncbi:MAG: hypothetical protein K2Q01_05430, partial [Rickettsiales bacterium]|nr:hypothetical protein [Rickettsiales bacterium]